MNIYIADAEPEQAMLFDQMQDFVSGRDPDLRQTMKRSQGGFTRSQMTQRKFADHEGVDQYGAVIKQHGQRLVAPGKMLDPY